LFKNLGDIATHAEKIPSIKKFVLFKANKMCVKFLEEEKIFQPAVKAFKGKEKKREKVFQQ
jgi:hypothetical protein